MELLNPFEEDDNDYDCNLLLHRNLTGAFKRPVSIKVHHSFELNLLLGPFHSISLENKTILTSVFIIAIHASYLSVMRMSGSSVLSQTASLVAAAFADYYYSFMIDIHGDRIRKLRLDPAQIRRPYWTSDTHLLQQCILLNDFLVDLRTRRLKGNVVNYSICAEVNSESAQRSQFKPLGAMTSS
ncbi:hypothetical protein KIN20_019646 [Parelaphostrongylus tenuis]|uniref:Uncharacterized protein n=1 Tax=Parelaphostrongylus tenuis TaxID=148309 RepID=A0AAD5MLG9_PARTN|nr:hypothetical protein KIN20_019646 [Parelaphostrongylus tenuis]